MSDFRGGLVFILLFILFLSPLPPGRSRGRVWTVFSFRNLGFGPDLGMRDSKINFHVDLQYSMLRNSASGPEIGLPGRILAGLLPGKHRNWPSGRPSAGRRADFGAFPVAVRPKSGPEGRCTARKHYCLIRSHFGSSCGCRVSAVLCSVALPWLRSPTMSLVSSRRCMVHVCAC